jgi:hypothetical protein
LRIEHAQALVHVVERNIKPEFLLDQFLSNPPNRHGSDDADAECAYDGGQRERNGAAGNRIGVDDFHHRESDGNAEHVGKRYHLPIPIFAEIAQGSTHNFSHPEPRKACWHVSVTLFADSAGSILWPR